MDTILNLLEAARLNGHSPYIWLRDALIWLLTWPDNRINELLPYAES
ncbi:transposase domain-containing protein [Brenneria uluponensis]